MLPLVKAQLENLGELAIHGGDQGFWDDWFLSRFLEGVCLRYVAYPVGARVLSARCHTMVLIALLRYEQDPDALVDVDEVVSMSQEDASVRALAAFKDVFTNGTKIELDHYLVYCARTSLRVLLLIPDNIIDVYIDFEYGRLLASKGDKEGARSQLELVFSGKPLEVNPGGRKVRTSSFL
jgi:hypothetical protein